MTQVQCSVKSCSYQKNGACHMNPINIGGKGAAHDTLTCCGSFLNKQGYSNLADYTSQRGQAEEVQCNVNTCKYNGGNACTRDQIQVSGLAGANIYLETECASFEKNR